MNPDRIREYWEDLRDNWDDPYWRADHPEVMAFVVAAITGIIGLLFTVLQILTERRLTPDA